MFRTVLRLSPSLSFGIFNKSSGQFDHDLLNRPTTTAPQTGWDRVKLMFTGK